MLVFAIAASLHGCASDLSLYQYAECAVETSEHFEQPGDVGADILVYVDHSTSMWDELEDLRLNMPTLLVGLDDVPGDHQIMFVTQDDGCHDGQIHDHTDPELFDTMALALATESYTPALAEAGLELAVRGLARTEYGRCNSGFLREGSQRVALMMSDEPDQSPQTDWQSQVDKMRILADPIVVVSVVGPDDRPTGCYADPGRGYAEASRATGGLRQSICDPDWDFTLGEIADISRGRNRTVALDGIPDGAIDVTVNGVPEGRFVHDAALGTIVFDEDAVPEPGASIDIDYWDMSPCE